MGERGWDAYSALKAGGYLAGGGLMYYLGTITEWARGLGPLGLALIAVASVLLAWLAISGGQALWAIRLLRETERLSLEKWRQEVDHLNPLSPEFHTKRIRLLDLMNPINRKISNKRFIDCELIGPANIALISQNSLANVDFIDCDVIVARPDVPVTNIVAMENTNIIGGTVWECTIFISQDMVPTFRKIGAKFVTLTGAPEIDNKPPQGLPPTGAR